MDNKLIDILKEQQINEMPWIDLGDEKGVDLKVENHPTKDKLIQDIKNAFKAAKDKNDVLEQLFFFLPMIIKAGITKEEILGLKDEA